MAKRSGSAAYGSRTDPSAPAYAGRTFQKVAKPSSTPVMPR